MLDSHFHIQLFTFLLAYVFGTLSVPRSRDSFPFGASRCDSCYRRRVVEQDALLVCEFSPKLKSGNETELDLVVVTSA